MATSPVEAVYWYNMSPKDGQDEASIPQVAIYKYEWRMREYPNEEQDREEQNKTQCEVRVGDEVWVKPGNVKCTTKWDKGTVTQVNSSNNVDVDGMARHILDVRRVVKPDVDDFDEEESNDQGEDVENFEGEQSERRYPQRERTHSKWMSDFSM